ncbi:acetyl-CoA carboxylase biotin carboxyl carrier protein subunit [Bacillus sp. VT 712]|uniref:Acetyl-CoA carboxylase biotin carboxyl carrier protein subunit n=1 Tax=Priestia veravalensis TaxID=1414648 RepID=A0A0V8JRP9_9BACI|nr:MULTISPECIES: biotin/lipoyl-containing protein [Bacillaceae]AQX53949.1 acetyl-CoA carboxylase biotin carboxyl carrier protein subunit [Priestia flexa]KSU89759.1 acetyl-CoA carboxylase biotin carboxyl carrier protein subunit [Priestia veravalensis]KZB92523.1 acetyl-CoA carboxylase biotin carboxyl carrier protein subunit [Bacillus sp. VT 712]MBY6084896.1 biotin/lipoyl-binding protein [Priestia flexa]MCA1200424.1 biotin/lipoyl-binding protein [Priestia flexa]
MKETTATMAGMVLNIHVSEGDSVTKGQVLIILESMKMEIPIESSEEGIVDAILVGVGDFVNEGDVLMTIS